MSAILAPRFFRTNRSSRCVVEISPIGTPSGLLGATLDLIESVSSYLGYQVVVVGLDEEIQPSGEHWNYLVLRVGEEKLQVLQYAAAGVQELISPTISSEGEDRIRFILDRVKAWQLRQDEVRLKASLQA